ncbi:hypothetical protein [Varibaculum prostatecancerukia]|uniref:hypothetical protein n=1 Tax=Varibaculum prostatecancerukia TaxID=2811781 RepID=UPI001C007D52|nr:hypothetical protein [Varibaculum prostatecancerukia]
MSYTPQPNSENPVPQGSPIPQSPQFSPVNPQIPASPMPPAVPPKKNKTGLIVTIVIVAVLVVALVGLFVANAVVAKTQEDNLKSSFTSEGFSKVQTEIDSSPMLISYFKEYYRHAKVTAAEGEFKQGSFGKQNAGKKDKLKIKDFKLDAYGLKGGDDPLIEKGNISFSMPGEELDKMMTDPNLTMKREGNKITAEGDEDGLRFQVVMRMQFEPGKSGESGKLFLVPDKFMINGSDEFMGQKLNPADMGMKKKEIPMDLNKAFVLKNVDFSGKDIKFDIDFKNVKLKDIGK